MAVLIKHKINSAFFIRILMLSGAIFIANYVHAGAYVQLVSKNGDMVTGQVTAWPENDDNEANPCYGWSSCYVGIDVEYESGGPGLGNSCGSNNAGCISDAQKYATRGELRQAFQKKLGIPYTSSFRISSLSSVNCMGLFYIPEKTSVITNTSAIYPGSICGSFPEPSQECSITGPAELDHGTLSNDADLTSSYSTGDIEVSCLLEADIKIFTYSTDGIADKIYLDSEQNIYATLTVNGQPSDTGVPVHVLGNKTPKKLVLQSQLHGTPTAGEHSGNAVVLLSYQ